MMAGSRKQSKQGESRNKSVSLGGVGDEGKPMESDLTQNHDVFRAWV